MIQEIQNSYALVKVSVMCSHEPSERENRKEWEKEREASEPLITTRNRAHLLVVCDERAEWVECEAGGQLVVEAIAGARLAREQLVQQPQRRRAACEHPDVQLGRQVEELEHAGANRVGLRAGGSAEHVELRGKGGWRNEDFSMQRKSHSLAIENFVWVYELSEKRVLIGLIILFTMYKADRRG